jgi:hypothetical protein
MLRGNGSARAETSVKATARPNTIRITMRRGPLRDNLDDDLSTIAISPFVTYIALALERSFRLARMRSGTGHSVRPLHCSRASPAPITYGIIIALPLTMRENQ